MAPRDPAANRAVTWVLVGCVAVALLGFLASAGVAAWLWYRSRDDVPAAVQAAPTPVPGLAQGQVPAASPAEPSAAPPSGRPGGSPPLTLRATVTDVAGNKVVPVGATCAFLVERHARQQGYWCRSQITCGGLLLYGGAQAGYFKCLFERSDDHKGVSGGDDMTTGRDGDASMEIDTAAHRLVIRDDDRGSYGAFTVTARIDSVQ